MTTHQLTRLHFRARSAARIRRFLSHHAAIERLAQDLDRRALERSKAEVFTRITYGLGLVLLLALYTLLIHHVTE